MPTTKKIDFTNELAALTSDEFTFTVPYHATIGEAQDVATFVRTHHKADKKTGAPGLVDGKLSVVVADEIEALITEVMRAQIAYRDAVNPKADTTKLDRARFLVDELGGALEFLFDDGVEDENDTKLTRLVAAHKDDPDSPDALAVELDEYAGLAESSKTELAALGGFDVAMIAEAKKLSRELLAMPANPPVSPDATAKLATRNRILQLIDRRVRRVRAVARWVFRHEPTKVQAVTSVYARKRRVDAKRSATRKKNGKPAEPTPAPTPNA